MGWVTIIWSMIAAVCLALAVIYWLVWWSNRTEWTNLLFSLSAVGAAGFSFCELSMTLAAAPGDFGTALRWGHLSAWLWTVSLVGFLWLYLQAGRAAPAATTPTATEPATPPPHFDAAQKIGMFAYAKNNQSNDQQLRDGYDCYNTVQQQTGINPDTPAPSGPSAAEVQAAQQQAAANAPEAQGGRVRGAARGAAGGAALGAITGNACRGAAVGATVGTVRGGRKQRAANEQSQQQAAQAAGSQLLQQANQAKAAYNQQMDTFKRGFSACMDARGYSVK